MADLKLVNNKNNEVYTELVTDENGLIVGVVVDENTIALNLETTYHAPDLPYFIRTPRPNALKRLWGRVVKWLVSL